MILFHCWPGAPSIDNCTHDSETLSLKIQVSENLHSEVNLTINTSFILKTCHIHIHLLPFTDTGLELAKEEWKENRNYK